MPIWFSVVEWSARLILLLLCVLSIWSVRIMLERRNYFKKLIAQLPNTNFDDTVSQDFEKLPQLPQSYLQEISSEAKSENVERRSENFLRSLQNELDKGLPVLGSLGATAPFIGLLGTVLGIINAFGDLYFNNQNTNRIMFLLAEALILTALGLVVAIPAVLAFNYFKRKSNAVLDRIEGLKNAYLNLKSK